MRAPGPTAAFQLTMTGNEKALGHKRDLPAEEGVTTATATLAPLAPAVKPARPKIDFAFLRQRVTMEQVLRQLGWLDCLRSRGLQRRGPCPIHRQPTDPHRSFSAHMGKHIVAAAGATRRGDIPAGYGSRCWRCRGCSSSHPSLSPFTVWPDA